MTGLVTATFINKIPCLGGAVATDNTTVVAGNLEVQKLQSGYSASDLNADPGEVVYYRILVANKGSGAVTDIEITDSTPAYTTQEGAAAVSDSGPACRRPPSPAMAMQAPLK